MLTQLHQIIAESARRNPLSPALSFGDSTLSYEELGEAVTAFARGLATIGLQRGERVAVYLDKRLETVVSIFGTSAAGGAFVPVNPVLKASQVTYILQDCSVRVLVTTAERLALLRDELLRTDVEHVVLLGEGCDTARGPVVHGWDEFMGGSSTVPATAIDLDMAAIFYTSGSTGKPKGVVLSHRNLLTGGASVSQYLENHADDIILAALPLSFDAGFSQLTTAFTVGAHVVLMNYLLPQTWCGCARGTGSPGLTCVPPLWIQLTEQQWPEEATSSLRYFANTGGRMPRSTLDKLRAIFPQAKPFLMYGLTEAFRSTYLDPAEVDRRPDSIGKAIPNAEILVRASGRHAVRSRRGGRARPSRSAGRARATGTTRSGRRSASSRSPGRDGALAHHRARSVVWRHGDRRRARAFSTSSGATTR